jgi:5-hydroxyisourate hydrolase
MAHARPTISTHVLDTGGGTPAVGVPVRLAGLLDDGAQRLVGEGVTDADGRIRSLIEELVPGVYRLTFELHVWRPGFLREVTLEFEVDDASRSWHVPRLVAPYGATTYRGS